MMVDPYGVVETVPGWGGRQGITDEAMQHGVGVPLYPIPKLDDGPIYSTWSPFEIFLAPIGAGFARAAGAGAAKAVAPSNGLGGNPFYGKAPQQIDDMFQRKGFVPKGPDPMAGKGSYINPNTGRKYYIDPGGTYKKGIELLHIDIQRPSESLLPKKTFPLGDKLFE